VTFSSRRTATRVESSRPPADGGHRVGNRKSVAVEEDDEVVGAPTAEISPARRFNLAGWSPRMVKVRSNFWACPSGTSWRLALHLIGLGDVPAEVGQLEVDPAG